MFEGETGVVCGAHLGGRDLVRGYGRAHARPGRRGDVDVTNTSNLGGREGWHGSWDEVLYTTGR